MFPYQQIIDKYYPAETPLRDIYMHHCRSVADKAIQLGTQTRPPVDSEDIEAAAMLHDIGIFLTDAAGIHCHGTEPYLTHAASAPTSCGKEVRRNHWPALQSVTLAPDLTPDDIAKLGKLLPPDRDYMPHTLLEKLICYADKFYSKNGDMKEKSLDRVLASLSKFGPDAVARFKEMHAELG